MAELKTLKNDASVEDFINSIPDNTKRADCKELLKVFAEITGEKPAMWGTAIVGYGMYHYKSERSSQEGDWPLTGFSPRKQSLTLYMMPGFNNLTQELEKLGKHKTSVSCLYIKKLADIDIKVLKKIIKKSFAEAKNTFDVI